MKPLPGMVSLFSPFPEVAARATRVMSLSTTQNGRPAGSYGFLESYCGDALASRRRTRRARSRVRRSIL
jgi:hypothetical protein